MQFWWKLYYHFFNPQESVGNKNFWEKRQTFQRKKIWPKFSHIIVHDKLERKSYKSAQGNLTFTVEVVRSFLKDLRGWWKDKFLKKTGSLSIEEKVWPKFLALSSVTNPKGQFIRIQKVFWQLVWSLQDHCYNTYEVVGNNFFF